MMPGPAIRFRNVNVSLGGHSILSDVSFDVAAGEVHCIVGPNGGGKTTLVRALLGQAPFDGKIELEGVANPVIGYAPQSLDLDRTLPFTVLDVLAVMNQRRPAFLGRSTVGMAEQDAMLRRVGLEKKSKRLFGFLSGGERQRLLFAQALLPRPDLLIMDESTSNMDDEGARLVEKMVDEASDAGTTVLWVNHDLEQVCRVARTATAVSRRILSHGAPRTTLAVRSFSEQRA